MNIIETNITQPGLIQRLRDSLIDVSISTFGDCGIDLKLGDPLKGVVAETNVGSWIEAERWLASQAAKHYPNSVFANWQRSKQEQSAILDEIVADAQEMGDYT